MMGEKRDEVNAGRIPSFHIVADDIPSAFYAAMDVVWHNGAVIRTQYDRKNKQGEYIDPPGRDATVMIEILNPFAQPRYPCLSFCEIGKYIAEIMGAKDHKVVPLKALKEGIKTGKIPKQWDYTYHQRLFAHPSGERSINQIDSAIERIAQSHFTRRAVATTRVPEVDTYLPEDLPCLGEVHFRCPEDDDGNLVLNMNTFWRSRDLYKAWHDNVIALTFMGQVIAQEIEKKTGQRTRLGRYVDVSSSLHIYGQDFHYISEDKSRGVKSFFDKFDAKSFNDASYDSSTASECFVIPQLEELLSEDEQWHFSDESRGIILNIIDGLKSGRLIA